MLIPIPTLVFGSVIAAVYGTLFHLWQKQGPGRLVLYIILALLGFWIGHLAAEWTGFYIMRIGVLNLGLATVGSVVLLFFGGWLSTFETN